MSMYDCAVCGEPRCEHVINELHEARSMLREAIEVIKFYSSQDRSNTNIHSMNKMPFFSPKKAREFLNRDDVKRMVENG